MARGRAFGVPAAKYLPALEVVGADTVVLPPVPLPNIAVAVRVHVHPVARLLARSPFARVLVARVIVVGPVPIALRVAHVTHVLVAVEEVGLCSLRLLVEQARALPRPVLIAASALSRAVRPEEVHVQVRHARRRLGPVARRRAPSAEAGQQPRHIGASARARRFCRPLRRGGKLGENAKMCREWHNDAVGIPAVGLVAACSRRSRGGGGGGRCNWDTAAEAAAPRCALWPAALLVAAMAPAPLLRRHSPRRL